MVLKWLILKGIEKMHSITVKNIPDDLYDRILKTARENHRSINSEIIARLERSLRSRCLDMDAFLHRIDDFQKGFKVPRLTEKLLQTMKEEGRL